VAKVSTFADAAVAYADLVIRIGPDQWAGPGLGDWSMRSLVGHASRSLITVESYLNQPAERVQVESAPAYYLAIRSALSADRAAVTERGVQAGLALGDDPAAAVADLIDRVLPLVERDDDPIITTIAGGMRLSAYLPTRTFELVVHGFDIARAAGLPYPAFGVAALTEVATVAAETAVLLGRGPELILALTGRGALSPGFSVV
jgi:uncharacterized protein (TIGR03083 family)